MFSNAQLEPAGVGFISWIWKSMGEGGEKKGSKWNKFS